MPFEPGDRVWLERRKWPDSHHYGVLGVFLGEDEFGSWIGSAKDTTRVVFPDNSERVMPHDAVSLVPRDEWYLLHFWYRPLPAIEVYVDVSTPAVWSERGVRAVDLDLDVLRWSDGRVEVEDEDEFAEHQVTLGYPAEVIAGARRSADDIVERLTSSSPPFDTACAAPWLALLRAR